MNDKNFFKTGKYFNKQIGQYNGRREKIYYRCSDRRVS